MARAGFAGADIAQAPHEALCGRYAGCFQDADGHLWGAWNPALVPLKDRDRGLTAARRDWSEARRAARGRLRSFAATGAYPYRLRRRLNGQPVLRRLGTWKVRNELDLATPLYVSYKITAFPLSKPNALRPYLPHRCPGSADPMVTAVSVANACLTITLIQEFCGMDFVVLAIMVSFFALMSGFVRACEKL